MPMPPKTRPGQLFSSAPAHQSKPQHSISAIPRNQYLLITTAGGIYAWDKFGAKKIFNSSKSAILAAKASKDGKQVLAVADSSVVVLHDCKRGRDTSWGLDGDGGQVRLLEYAPDARSLYLSTSLTGAIQCYSMHEARMLDPAQTHPSPPTVLAVNSTGQLMISASEFPPVVYLQNLTLGTSALQLSPAASQYAVTVASFHPERPNLFMLAFKDGTLAAYDATKIARRNGIRMDVNSSLDKYGTAGEISRFKQLHRSTARGSIGQDWAFGSTSPRPMSSSVAISGAAFMSGYRSRAVSVGADGKCRIIDFEEGGQILRTWHAQAPITSLAVLPVKSHLLGKGSKKSSVARSAKNGAVDEGNNVIAIGRADGKVVLYDSLGLKLQDVKLDQQGNGIMALEWVSGESPGAIEDLKSMSPHASRKSVIAEGPTRQLYESGIQGTAAAISAGTPQGAWSATARSTTLVGSPRQQEAYDTVVRSSGPSAETPGAALPFRLPAKHLDLFSPVKKQAPPEIGPLGPRESPPRALNRPRLQSTTFELKPRSSEDVSPKTSKSPGRSVTFSEEVENAKTRDPSPRRFGKSLSPRKKFAVSPKKRGATVMIIPGHMVSSSSETTLTTTSSSTDTRNGQILADLRRLGMRSNDKSRRKSANRAFFAPYMNRTPASNIRRRRSQGQLLHAANNGTLEGPSSSAITSTDSTAEAPEVDIWITEGSETETVAQRRNKKPSQRPQEGPYMTRAIIPTKRETPQKGPTFNYFQKSSIVSPPVLHPTPKQAQAPSLPGAFPQGQRTTSSEDKYTTAPDHFATDGTFSPVPTSTTQEQRSAHAARKVLVELDNTGVNSRTGTSIARRSVKRRSIEKQGAKLNEYRCSEHLSNERSTDDRENNDVHTSIHTALVQASTPPSRGFRISDDHERECTGCADMRDEVRDMRAEMARLKAEVLGMRTAMRRAGVVMGK